MDAAHEDTARSRPLPGEFGLTQDTIQEILARDQRKARLFVHLVMGGCGLLWLTLTALLLAHGLRTGPWAGLLLAPVVGLIGAVIGGLPVAVLAAVFSWLAVPAHPQAGALERYEEATRDVGVCEVCRLVRGDETPKEGVIYCSRCGTWICGPCRRRYDLRAIAALKQHARDPVSGRRMTT